MQLATECRPPLPRWLRHACSIYARYRMLAEMLGIIFCRESQKRGINIFVETSVSFFVHTIG